MKGRKERKIMKRRKILYLFPLAALILSGCTFQEGWETVKGFMGDKVYEPAKSWVEKLLGKESKEEEKGEKEAEQSGEEEEQGHGHGGGGGGSEEQSTKYGTAENPISITEALEIIEEECANENDVTKQVIYTHGTVKTVYNTFTYNEGPAFEIDVEDDEHSVYVYRVHGTEADKPNCKEGSLISFHGYAKNFKGTLEFCDVGSTLCTIDSLAKPQGTEAVSGIEFDEASFKLQVGQTRKVTASVLPLDAGNQNYTLSLEDVAPEGCVELLEGDTLKANAVGTAKIVATSEEGGFEARADVTVVEAINYGSLESPLSIAEAIAVINKESPSSQPVYVTGVISKNDAYSTKYSNTNIWLADEDLEFELYGCTLPADFTPAQPAKDDPALVGKIVVAHGTAKKFVKDSSSTYELDKGCAIDTVSEPAPIEIESVTVTPAALNLEVGEQANISATVSPAKASQEVSWEVQNPDTHVVATYEDGKITAVAAGEATVVATSVADSKVSGLCSVVVTEATKTLESIAITGEATKTEYVEEEAYSADGLKVMAHYDKGDDVDVTDVAEITVSPTNATYGDTKFTVTATYSTAAAVTKDVAVTVAIKHGSLAHPYSVAEARAAVDAGEGITNVHATGYVSQIVTAYDSGFGNVSFNISADGLPTGDQLQGYRTTVSSADDVAVGDKVVLRGNLTVYKGTYEFAAGNTIVDRVQPTAINSIVISGEATTTEYAPNQTYNHEGLVAIANLDNGGKADVSSVATWNIDPQTATLGDTEIAVTATYANVTSEEFAVSVTVTSAPIEQIYKSVSFAAANTSDSVQSYTATATYTDGGFSVNTANFNNNKKGWDFIKCGRSKDASVATITTAAAIDKQVTKVNISFTTYTAVNGTTAKVLVSSSADMSNAAEYAFTPAENTTVAVPITTGVANAYYQVVFDCVAGGSNGYIWVTAVSYSAVY